MPNFTIPLLYKNSAVSSHRVILLLTEPYLITGGANGDIIVWNTLLQPQVIMYPNLSDSAGQVNLMLIIKSPFIQLLDKIEQVLLTVHQDQRVRLWDIRDGRCLQISPHAVFGTCNINFAQALNNIKCRFVVFSGNNCNQLMLFDLWKMKVVKQYLVPNEEKNGQNTTIRHFCKQNNSIIFVIDSQNYIHQLDVSSFQNELFLDYFQWKEDGQKSLELFKLSELLLIQTPTLIQFLPTKELIRGFFEEELQALILVFTNQISLIFFTNGKPYQILFQQSRNTFKFTNAAVYYGEQKLLLISTRVNICLMKQGNLTAIKWNDIIILLTLLKNDRDLSFGYQEFSFQKSTNSNTAIVQLNMQQIFKQSIDVLSGHKGLKKYSQSVIVNNSFTNSKIFQYNNQSHSLVTYSSVESIAQCHDFISFFTKEQSGNIAIDNFDYFLNTSSILVKDVKLTGLYTVVPTQSFDFMSSKLEYLHETLESIFTSHFQQLIYPNLVQYLKKCKITTSCLFVDKYNTSIYYFGCDNGYLYGFPLFFPPLQTYPIYIGKIDSGPGCAVQFLYVKKNILIVSSARGRIITVDFQNKMKKSTIPPQDQSLQQQSQTSQILKQSIDKEKPFEEINILIWKVSDSVLTSTGINHLKVREVLVDLSEEEQSLQENSEYVPIIASDIIKKLIGIQLQNNTIIIYSLETGLLQAKLNGITKKVQIYGLYFEQKQQIWLITSDDGNMYIFGYSGNMERIVPFTSHYHMFGIEQKLKRLQKKNISFHILSEYKLEYSKSISQEHSLLEYGLRGSFVRQKSALPTMYEKLGPIQELEFKASEAHKLLWMIEQNKISLFSKILNKNVSCVVQTKIGDMEWWDLRRQQLVTGSVQDQSHLRDRLVSTLFPWGVDQTLDAHLESLLGGLRPVFNPIIGIQSLGNAFSFILTPRWGVSEYLTSLQAMAIMHYYINLSFKDNNLMTSLMFQTVELFTKKKKQVDPNFKSMNLCQLARYTIDDSNEVMTAACNLIISQIINKEQDIKESVDIVRAILRLQYKYPDKNGQFSNTEVICLVVESYCSIFSERPLEIYKLGAERVIQGIDLKSCIINPHFTAVLLKQIIDGLQYFRPFVNPVELLQKLFFIFFHYNTALEYMNSFKENPQLGKKGLQVIEEFNRQSDEMKKRMKQLIVKAIIHVGNISLQDFYALIRKDILNLELHILYPCSIIDLIRNYIKSSQQHSIKHLPFLVEIILKSLDPNNPNLRKVCHRAATNALHTICKMFQCVSFHQASQKIALGSSDNQIIIYDLRTAVKWRVLDGHEGQVAALGFDNQGKHLASYSQADSTLRIWKVGQTGFFGSILGIQGKHIKLIKTEKRQIDFNAKITIQWNEQDNKIVFLRFGDQSAQQYKVF